MNTMTPQEILALPMSENDAGATSIGDYLTKLLALVWRDGEGFNGKRPFGNSSWEGDLYHPLARAGLIEGVIDEDGYLEDCDSRAANALIDQAIAAMTAPPAPVMTAHVEVRAKDAAPIARLMVAANDVLAETVAIPLPGSTGAALAELDKALRGLTGTPF